MVVMKRSISTLWVLVIIVLSLFLDACSGNDEETSSNASIYEMRGTWTTVACQNVPSTLDISDVANVSFLIEYEDGIYDLWSYEMKYYNVISQNGSAIESAYGTSLLTIKSFREKEIDAQIPMMSNAILTMKKIGALNDDDYKFKICNGVWLFGSGSDNYGSYLRLPNNTNLAQIVGNYGNGAVVVSFHQDGTGNYTGSNRHTYTFRWNLTDKTLTQTIDGIDRQIPISFVGIEGEVLLKCKYNIWN